MTVESTKVDLSNQMAENGDRRDGHQIINWQELGVEKSAETLIDILAATYGRHNLSSSVAQTIGQIEQGVLEPVFLWNIDHAAACAALIKKDGAVEIGRAANAPGERGGGKLMLELVRRWKDDEVEHRPLVAEIRMSAPFAGIAGGQGSQATLLGKVGMVPHAILPAFHHPGPHGPDRQEFFCFASLEKEGCESKREPVLIMLPDDRRAHPHLLAELLFRNGVSAEIKIGDEIGVHWHPDLRMSEWSLPFSQVAEVPFNLFVEGKGSSTDFREDRKGSSSQFDLVVMSPSVTVNDPTMIELLIHHGFRVCGITAPFEGETKLLLGRVRRPITVAPVELMRGFPLINKVDLLQVIKEQDGKTHERPFIDWPH